MDDRRRRQLRLMRINVINRPNRPIADHTNPLEVWDDAECFENLRFDRAAVIWTRFHKSNRIENYQSD